MTIDQIRPIVGTRYRHRATGNAATVGRYDKPGGNHNVVELASDHGWHWIGTRDEFWAEFIHADLYDTERN